MWRVVAENTGTQWVRMRLDDGLGIAGKKRKWDDPTSRRLVSEVGRAA